MSADGRTDGQTDGREATGGGRCLHCSGVEGFRVFYYYYYYYYHHLTLCAVCFPATGFIYTQVTTIYTIEHLNTSRRNFCLYRIMHLY